MFDLVFEVNYIYLLVESQPPKKHVKAPTKGQNPFKIQVKMLSRNPCYALFLFKKKQKKHPPQKKNKKTTTPNPSPPSLRKQRRLEEANAAARVCREQRLDSLVVVAGPKDLSWAATLATIFLEEIPGFA